MENLEIIEWQEGKNLTNFSREQIFQAIQDIDHAVFHDGGFSTVEMDIARYEAFRDGYIFAVHEDKIIGYFNWFPITEKFYKEVVKAEHIFDGDIENSYICGLNDTGNFLFFLSLAVLPEFHKKGISKEFSKIMLEKLSKLEVKDIVSYAYTIEGEHFANIFGIKPVKVMDEEGIKLVRLAKVV